MRVDQVTGNRFAKLNQTLRPGQIIQGKILKLYPDNKAQIQLGSQKMIAQLEASLTTGGKYHFQVQTTDDVIHLKVLGEQLKSRGRANVIGLIRQLGLKATKTNMSFLQILIDEKVPFDRSQLMQAFQLLEGSQNKEKAQQIIKNMIIDKLPITDSVMQALSMRHSHRLSEQKQALLQQLQQDTNQTQLADRLSQMVKRPLNAKNAMVNQIITEAGTNNQQFFNTLKAAGVVDSQMEFGSWKLQWESYAEQRKNMPAQQFSAVKLPVQMDDIQVVRAFEQMNNNKSALFTQSREIRQTWETKLTQAMANNAPLSGQDFTQLKQQISQNVMPLLTNEQQQQLTQLMQNNPLQFQQLLSALETMNMEQIYTKAEQFLTHLNQDKAFMLASPREQFLMQINQTLLFTGLSYENQLANDAIQQQTVTVKAMLMQLLNQGDGPLHERSRQLLHFINGMQLQSVNESNTFLQANLLVPGERLGLSNDLELDFEGKRSENGEINPDYCRILFYLDLVHLKETVIDMNIQKRAVAVTIFNDEAIKERSESLKPNLKAGLESLDYHLTAISFRPLQQSEEPKKNLAGNLSRSTYQGVDYRI